ncbi:hypothetical protein [Sulfitobacter pacificus]|uniref:Rap1a immunity protein domain-containing protein n=1 Tax=Sulfitobacter pacificus TaxID=1499314 RepID=A0ABQ5VJH6_9RHOB|nr:hypothetical protein [Sulfitobacter pacificus]GLQ27283.1 hypothetical protein GCM10007927_20860 [Sulfitobacter pacificus]
MKPAMNMLMALLVVLGIVLPKATAALALVLPTYGQTITICTPEGISTVTLDANGDPVHETEQTTAPCLLAYATLVQPASLPDWHRLARQIDAATLLETQTTLTAQRIMLRPPCRAPPAL